MRREKSGSSCRRDRKERTSSVPRPLSWFSLSSLSRRTRWLFRSQGELSAGQQEDEDDWVYKPQHLRAVSNLDEESKWTVHYSAPWHQQENVFLPTNRPACVEDLHRQAKVNLKTVLRECDKLRKDGFRSSQYYSQGPIFSSTSHASDCSLQDEEEDDSKSTGSSAEGEKLVCSARPQTPLVGDIHDVSRNTNKPLPTPEERMRQQAQTVATDIIPINVTGESFDRQASIRRSLVNTDTVVRRPKKVKRRKTVSGLPDDIQKELAANGQSDVRAQSMYIPDQYSTLSRTGSVSSSLSRTSTRDSSCQTEEVKIVKPSMRRIRAQRGQGIAAQMASMSASSSGCLATTSDGTGVVFTKQLNGGSQRFHSLPRHGARVSLHGDPTYNPDNYCQVGKLQADETVVHLRNVPRNGTLPRPKSQEVRSSTSEQATTGPAHMVSPHAAYSTSLIPNATLSSSTEVIALRTANSSVVAATHKRATLAGRKFCVSSENGVVKSEATATSSTHWDSAVSLSSTTYNETSSQCSTLNGTKGKDTTSECSYSDGSLRSQDTIAADQWIYDTPENVLPKKPLTSSCSSPINHIYRGLEHSPKTDTGSLYSMDNDGYYTTMHLDCGLRSRSQDNLRRMRHSMYEYHGHHGQGDRSSLYSDKSLSRSISLRKPKKAPLPPARTDSLQRRPGKRVNPNSSVLNEKLIATLQQSLQMNVKHNGLLPSQSPCSDYEDIWLLRPRSHSSVSGGSSAVSACAPHIYSICPITPSQSDTSSLRSDYAESWGYFTDYPRPWVEQQQSTDSSGRTRNPGEIVPNPNLQQKSQAETADSTITDKPKPVRSPEQVHRLTSPSSGYSSQSNTPTTGTPVPAFMRTVSPGGARAKPKVPERKSSLLSSMSMSSSSTSLSSNTSDSVRNPMPVAPPLLPDMSSLPSVTIAESCTSTTSPPQPFHSSVSESTAKEAVPTSTILSFPTSTEATDLSASDFPMPPPEVLMEEFGQPDIGELSPPPPPPPFPNSTPVPPPPPLPPAQGPLGTLSISLKGLKTYLKPVGQPLLGEERITLNSLREVDKPSMPLITTQALQMVQLKSIKKLENYEAKAHEQTDDPSRTPETPQNPETPLVLTMDMNTITPVSGTEMLVNMVSVDESGIPQHQHSDNVIPKQLTFVDSLKNPSNSNTFNRLPPSFQTPSPKPKPPIIPKKPKLSLSVLNPCLQTTPEDTHQQTDVINVRSHQNGQSTSGATENRWVPLQQDSESAEEEQEADSTKSSTTLADSRTDSSDSLESFTGTPVAMQEFLPLDNTATGEDALDSKGDDNGEVFEPSPSHSSSGASLGTEVQEEMVTPTRPRTTEDLFAAIHRSKRKVLGRRESEEDHTRGHSPSPPVTPTAVSPCVSSSSRQPSSIQRSVRRSATSSDSFKALLLKKGSRSEGSFRMSATEMLRSTDPRVHRPHSESSLDAPDPDSPCGSPGRPKRGQEEWVRFPGASPLSLGGVAKYGRSRTPPSAASSKYNARSRIASSPMTVICERDGEAEDSSGTLAEQSI